jgi:C4-dicarboxylate-binding protein DctP
MAEEFQAFLKDQKNFEIYYPTDEERAAFREKANVLSIWNELCKPWLDKHYPGQNMTEKILAELEANRKLVLSEKAAK